MGTADRLQRLIEESLLTALHKTTRNLLGYNLSPSFPTHLHLCRIGNPIEARALLPLGTTAILLLRDLAKEQV